MNISLLYDKGFSETLQELWIKWQTHKRYYPNAVMWWTRYIKAQFKKLFVGEGIPRHLDRIRMEDFHYGVTYTAFRDAANTDTLHVTLKELKEKNILATPRTQRTALSWL
jgi:hypothetical protein